MADPTLSLTVNQQPLEIPERYWNWSLLRYLRDVLGLTGTKWSCDSEGTCGACTLIVNGKARRACLTPIKNLSGARVETIEALQIGPEQIPHPLLQTVVQDGIFQCGYCAPGALLSAKALLDENLNPTEKEIERALSTVICRCAGLNRMDRSVQRAAAILRGDQPSTWTPADTAAEERLLARLTGKMPYTADLRFPNMLYAQAVRAGAAHARLTRLDVSQAESMPGVAKILTRKDVPGANAFGIFVFDQPIFLSPGDEVRHVGDVLAVIVAESPEQAAAAAAAVDFALEPLPVLTSPQQALAADAPVLHERLRLAHPEEANVLAHHRTRKGDVAEGFAAADVIVEGEYSVPFVEHAYMEIECSTAVPESDGSLTLYCGTQGPMEDRHQVAAALGLPEERIRIAHQFMGGGFGGKEDIAGQIHAALGAYHTGRPVKVQWTRAESLAVSTKRHALRMRYRTGADRSGKLTAAEAYIVGDTGPYASVGEAVLFRACVFSCGPYVVPHAQVDSLAVHTNNAVAGAFRGFGSPQVAFASEIQMQKLADALGLDPIEFRLRNALEVGQATITGDILTHEVGVSIKACLLAVREALAKTPPPQLLPGEKLGVGVAAAYKNVGLGQNLPDSAGASVSLEADGRFLVRHGATDMGQGINDAIVMITARALGIPTQDVAVHTADTRYDPPGGVTTASRQTFISGNAALRAAEAVREQLWKTVSEEFGVPVEDLALRERAFVQLSSGRRLIDLQTLAASGPRFEARITYDPPTTADQPGYSPAQPTEKRPPLHFAYDYGVQAALVAVQPETGAVRVLKVIAAHDVGRTISRRNVIGQIEGAIVQGLGYALSESFVVENGLPKTLKFKDLGLLRFRDLPEIEPIIIEDPHVLGPFGAKGMGELTISPTAPAVVNAIHDAVGVWMTELPVTPEKLLAALRAAPHPTL